MSTSADSLNNGAIPAINFSKLFSQEELHAKLVESKKLLNVHQILNIEKTHFWIYAICFGISAALILLYLLDCCSYLASLLNVLMSIGAGGISAVLLALFIEAASTKSEKISIVGDYNNCIACIYYQLYVVMGCRSHEYMRLIQDPQVRRITANSSAQKYIQQFSVASTLIASFLLKHASHMHQKVQDEYFDLQQQLTEFIGTMSFPPDTDNLIALLDGTKSWLQNWYTEDRLKEHFLFYK